jgi:hypothetical protein
MTTSATSIFNGGSQNLIEKTPDASGKTADDDKKEEPIPEKQREPRKLRTLSAISQVVSFSQDEYDFLILGCKKVNLTPRTIKRLVNFYTFGSLKF